jgi:hypothetical protein
VESHFWLTAELGLCFLLPGELFFFLLKALTSTIGQTDKFCSMAKLKKSTVKFQKHHLKQEIERRKKHKKVQQAYKRRIDSRNNGDRSGAGNTLDLVKANRTCL